MIPIDYPLADPAGVREFRDLPSPRGGALLAEEDVHGYEVYQAQLRLAQKLEAEPPERLAKFTRSATERRYRGWRDRFQIHRGKLMDVLSFLEERDMAWSPSVRERGDWVALHPDLGTAVMSYIAIAIADAKGLDIVTDSTMAHLAVVTRSEDAVFAELMSGYRARRRANPADAADMLAMLVMRSCFDVSKLSPVQIADLINDGKSLLDFKRALLPIVETIPTIQDQDELERRFHTAAKEVLDQWRRYKKSLPRFALNALIQAANVDTPKVLTTLTAGLGGNLLVGVEGALTFGIVGFTGVGIVRELRKRANHPFRYLSKIERAGGVLAIAQGA